jgi:hypothetical protein
MYSGTGLKQQLCNTYLWLNCVQSVRSISFRSDRPKRPVVLISRTENPLRARVMFAVGTITFASFLHRSRFWCEPSRWWPPSSGVGRLLVSAPGKLSKKELLNQLKFDVMIFFFEPLILLFFFFLSTQFIFISYYYSVNFNLWTFAFYLFMTLWLHIPSYEFFYLNAFVLFIISSLISLVVCTNRQHLRASKSITVKSRFDCRIKIRLLHNFALLCNRVPGVGTVRLILATLLPPSVRLACPT